MFVHLGHNVELQRLSATLGAYQETKKKSISREKTYIKYEQRKF